MLQPLPWRTSASPSLRLSISLSCCLSLAVWLFVLLRTSSESSLSSLFSLLTSLLLALLTPPLSLWSLSLSLGDCPTALHATTDGCDLHRSSIRALPPPPPHLIHPLRAESHSRRPMQALCPSHTRQHMK